MDGVKILFLVITIFLLVRKSKSDPIYLRSDCPITTVFAPKSKYEANLNTLFQSLSANATNSDFFSSAVNDVVYGLFLCRGDVNTTTCSDCVSTATTVDLPETYCRNRKRAVIWYDECMVRYSNHPLSGKMEFNPEYPMTSITNTTGSQAGFPELLYNTLNDMVARAGSTITFATSEVKIKEGQQKTLYTLAQCTPDLNTSGCTECLNKAINILPLSDGARILAPSCNIRYEIYKFFTTSTPIIPAPGLAPAPLDNSLSPTLSPQSGTIDNLLAPTLAPPTKGTDNPIPRSPGTSASIKRTWSYFNFLGAVFAFLNMYCNILI